MNLDPAIRRRNRDIFNRARERISRAGKGSLDILFISHSESAGNDRNFFLITGIDRGSFLYSSAMAASDGSVQLFVHELEEEEAKETGLPFTVIRPGEKTVFNALKTYHHVGVNAEALTLAEAGRFKDTRIAMVNISPELEDARACKSKKEKDHLRTASRIAAETAHDIPKMVRQGMTERELAGRIDFRMAELGAEGKAFETIAAFGERSAIPHAVPTDRKVGTGDFILCDFGASSGKMLSDITRVYIYGTASEAQKNLYHAILKIQESILNRIRVGESGKSLHALADSAVSEYFTRLRAPGKMGHSLGHSIGLYSHDGKRLAMNTDYILPSDFVTTVEPGGYLPGFGGVRIEDMVLVTREKTEILTDKAPKTELIEIPVRST